MCNIHTVTNVHMIRTVVDSGAWSMCGQVTKFSLRPLYDPLIPLETFATSEQAGAFRDAIRAATEASWANARTCQANCTDGFCR